MANKKFTEEEMRHLRASPYVLDISPSIVHFSAEFKEMFGMHYKEDGNRGTSLEDLASTWTCLTRIV